METQAIQNKKQDETIFKKLIKLFIPIFLELLLINLLSSVDTLMLSNYNKLCVNAVGTAQSTISLLTSLIVICSNGVAILVGQFLGAKKDKEAKDVLAQGVIFNLFLGILLFLIFFFLSDYLLKLVNTSDTFFGYAKTYIRIYAIALPFQAITQVVGADFRAHEKPIYLTIISIISNFINVGLNYLLIYGIWIFPELGIKGAAISTVVSLIFKTISIVILEIIIIKDKVFTFKVDKNILGSILKIGGPSALENISYTLFSFVLLAALNLLTDVEIGSRVFINMVLGYTLIFSSSLGNSNSILVAYYVGAHEYEKAKKLTLRVCLVGLGIMVTLISLLNIFGRPLFTLITNDKTYVDIIVKILPLLFILEIGRCTNIVVISAQKSAGDVIFPLVLGLLSMSIIMAGGSWLFSKTFELGLVGIILAQSLDEFVRGIVSFIRWLSNGWMKHSLIKE